MYEAARQIKRGNIYWVRVDENASGSLERKSRPAVIVSNDKNNAASSVLEVVFLTASIKRLDLPTHTVVFSSHKPSVALCEQIQAVSREQLGTCIGKCSHAEMINIDRCICRSLGIEYSDTVRDRLDQALAYAELYKELYMRAMDLLRKEHEAWLHGQQAET